VAVILAVVEGISEEWLAVQGWPDVLEWACLGAPELGAVNAGAVTIGTAIIGTAIIGTDVIGAVAIGMAIGIIITATIT
jgi:hypothetical protein